MTRSNCGLGMKANEPALCVVERQTRDSTAVVCLTVLKYIATSFQVPQLNHLRLADTITHDRTASLRSCKRPD